MIIAADAFRDGRERNYSCDNSKTPLAEIRKKIPEEEDEEEDDEDDVMSESEFIKQNPEKNNKMRTSVSAEAYGEWNKKTDFTPPVYPKSEEQKTRLGNTLNNSFMFRALNAKEMGTVSSFVNSEMSSGSLDHDL